jgi:SpoVK/Ycf46/Vps4 family AAA+-type ATPase
MPLPARRHLTSPPASAPPRPRPAALLAGPPGTGKSELVRFLAKEMGVVLREISNQDDYGDSIAGHHRLKAYRAAQCFFSKQPAMLLFDEIEDVFDDGADFWGRLSTAHKAKAWINKALEENPVPTFWLSNSSHIDPAFIRRFDMCIEMPVPHRQQRERILKENCSDLIGERDLKRFSQTEHLSPAVVNKVSSVLKGIRDEIAPESMTIAFETLANNTLKAQGYARMPRENTDPLPTFYNPAYVNCARNLVKVYEGIKQCKEARMCLFGPPGTGKTAYGRWLAQQLDKPLLIKRASDLLSMWVGGTEENIAKAFDEARSEGSILLIDEVDSFLQDRRGAHHSWEVSGVNEMLTQMEAFNGIFIASTNLMDNLDQAALRRFDVKLYFDFMTAEQAHALFRDYANSLGIMV